MGFELAPEADLRDALEKAFDCRGDVIMMRKNRERIDDTSSTAAAPVVRVIPQNSREENQTRWNRLEGRLSVLGQRPKRGHESSTSHDRLWGAHPYVAAASDA